MMSPRFLRRGDDPFQLSRRTHTAKTVMLCDWTLFGLFVYWRLTDEIAFYEPLLRPRGLTDPYRVPVPIGGSASDQALQRHVWVGKCLRVSRGFRPDHSLTGANLAWIVGGGDTDYPAVPC